MRIVIALGGNALLQRGEPLTAEVQRRNVQLAAQALAPLAAGNELVISHGNGPQVGLFALQGAAYKPDEAFPLDVLDAQTEGMIGYMIEQELGNLLPSEVPFATLLTMVEVDPGDPGFRNETRPVRWLLERGTVVICAGGGGIPTLYDPEAERTLIGVEAVVDKDACSELLAREVEADLFIMATDAEAVFLEWGTPQQRGIHRANPAAIRQHSFPPGSMGPKVDAACRFALATGRSAAIGALADIPEIVRGEKGTQVDAHFEGLTYHA
jgi:carbamate kinase